MVTSALCALGVVCGPILDITYSRHYDLTDGRLIQWVIYLMEQGRLRSFLVAPPCTTFSPAAHPALRSYRVPEGFQRLHPRVHLGNRLAFASLALLFAGLRLRVFGLGEQPRRSKMRWLKQWQRLLVLGAREAFLAACMYGSPHQKEFVGMQVELLARRRSRNHTHLREFVFVAVGMQVELLARRRSRNHTHLRIEGAYTKPSAIYCEGLASAFATFFRDHLRAHDAARARFELNTDGLEDQLSNDASLSLEVFMEMGTSHVNILHSQALQGSRCGWR